MQQTYRETLGQRFFILILEPHFRSDSPWCFDINAIPHVQLNHVPDQVANAIHVHVPMHCETRGPGVWNRPVINCIPEPGRSSCVISIQKGVIATSAEKKETGEKTKFSALYIPSPGIRKLVFAVRPRLYGILLINYPAV